MLLHYLSNTFTACFTIETLVIQNKLLKIIYKAEKLITKISLFFVFTHGKVILVSLIVDKPYGFNNEKLITSTHTQTAISVNIFCIIMFTFFYLVKWVNQNYQWLLDKVEKEGLQIPWIDVELASAWKSK